MRGVAMLPVKVKADMELIWMVTSFVAVWEAESSTFTVMGNEPEAVGVPESMPSEASIRPWGRAPVSDQVKGAWPPLETVKVNE